MNSPIRLAIVTGIWKRPDIFKMFAEGIKNLQRHFDGRIEIIVCVAGSEGRTSQDLVRSFNNFFYTEVSNKPLGRKMNAACALARRFSPNYCLMLGSDDIIGVNLMERYYEEMQRGTDYVYLTDCFFFDTSTKKGLYWGGYIQKFNKGKGAGIGRLISTKLLGAINWVCWPDGFDSVLDTGFDKQVDRISCSKKAINVGAEKLFALDIKSPENMTPFRLWENSKYIDGKNLLFNNLPEHLAQMIYGKK